MTPREAVGYLVLLLLIGALAGAWLAWRRQVRMDRIRRWGTPHSPAKARRRGRS